MAANEKVQETFVTAQKEVNLLTERAKQAQEEFMLLDQDAVNQIVQKMALAGLDKHMLLAKMAVEETGRGVYEDKITKNIFATEYIYHSIKNEKTVGVVEDNPYENYRVVAEPVGVIAGITPVTNPTSTTMFKALIATKTRNPIIFAFHPSAQKSSREAAKTLLEAAVAAGAPEHCIQWIDHPSVEATQQLMNHKDVALVLATGGSAMVKSAYSTGKPALGVGPGNVPCFIERTADLDQAVTDLILSKTFDNGMICASEQAVILDEAIYTAAKKKMTQLGCYFLNKEETEKVSGLVINSEKCAVNAVIVGQPAVKIAEMAGITVPQGTKILVAELAGVGDKYPLSAEKLSPVLACYKVKSAEQGIERAAQVVAFGGMAGCAMIGQSVINVSSGGRGRLSTFWAGAFLLFLIVVLGPYVARIPMAALVAVMIMVSINTFQWRSLKTLLIHPKSSSVVMLGTVAVVVATHDLAKGVLFGVVLSGLFFAHKVTRFFAVASEREGDKRIYRVSGQIFFATAEAFHAAFDFREEEVQHVVIDLSAAHFWDITAINALDRVVLKFRHHDIAVEIVGMNQATATMVERLAVHDKRDGTLAAGH